MDATTVVRVIARLEEGGIDVWLDGGWGVDALLGEQTRSHSDLDVIVRASDSGQVQETLRTEGFVRQPGGSARNFVLTHPQAGEVDVHAIDFDERGFGAFLLPDGGSWAFPPSGFAGKGRVSGREVRCLSAEAQVQCHGQGYAPTEKDLRDMELLQTRFGVVLPLILSRRSDPSHHTTSGEVRIGSIVIRCYEWRRMRDFWREALRYEVSHADPKGGFVILSDPAGKGPNVSLDQTPAPRTKRGWLHLDLYTANQRSEVERLVQLGARRYDWRYPTGADYVVLEDPDGNLFCVCQIAEQKGQA